MADGFPYGSFYRTRRGGFIKSPAGMRGRPKYINPEWQIDHDFYGTGIYPQFMLAIGSSIYMQMSNSSIIKRDSAGNYSTIKTGLSMAGSTIPSLGNDNGQLLIDSQHSGRDKVYKLDDDGTLTLEEMPDAEFTSQGYAGLVNNGTYLFWMHSHNWLTYSPTTMHYTNRFRRISQSNWDKETFEIPPSDYNEVCASFLDQRFQNAIMARSRYYTGDDNILTQNQYVSGYAPNGQNMGIFNGELYTCNGASPLNDDLWKLPSLDSAWVITDTGLGTYFQSCYGYGSYLYISAYAGSYEHIIYKWDGLTFVVDSLFITEGARAPYSGSHRFITCGNYIYLCAFGRILKKQIA